MLFPPKSCKLFIKSNERRDNHALGFFRYGRSVRLLQKLRARLRVPSEEKKTDKKISPAEFMEKYAEEIEKTVKKAIKEGMGFFAYYEVKESVDSAFMEELIEELEEMFGYDVSFKENVLEIGFQNAM